MLPHRRCAINHPKADTIPESLQYGIEHGSVRAEEQNLRSTAEVLHRAFEISSQPVSLQRAPSNRVVSICRHFALLHTALLRSQGLPARVRCGFSSYFDPKRWYDHWITERWDGERWVRDDPQIDDLQAKALKLGFDPRDQPPGRFLTGSEAWIAARAGEVDAEVFGISDRSLAGVLCFGWSALTCVWLDVASAGGFNPHVRVLGMGGCNGRRCVVGGLGRGRRVGRLGWCLLRRGVLGRG